MAPSDSRRRQWAGLPFASAIMVALGLPICTTPAFAQGPAEPSESRSANAVLIPAKPTGDMEARVAAAAGELGLPNPYAPKPQAPRIDANGMPLGQPIDLSQNTARWPTAAELLEQQRRDRQVAARAAKVLCAVTLALGVLNILLYLSQPKLGARRLAVVAAVATSIAVGVALTAMIDTWTAEMIMAAGGASMASGQALLFLALLGLASWRWVAAGFRMDRAASGAARIPAAKTGDA